MIYAHNLSISQVLQEPTDGVSWAKEPLIHEVLPELLTL